MGHLQAGLIQIVNRCGVRYGRLRVPCTVGAYLCRGVEGRRVLEHGRKPDWPGGPSGDSLHGAKLSAVLRHSTAGKSALKCCRMRGCRREHRDRISPQFLKAGVQFSGVCDASPHTDMTPAPRLGTLRTPMRQNEVTLNCNSCSSHISESVAGFS